MYCIIIVADVMMFQLENLVREMQDLEHGVPVRSQKLFLTSIPAAFMGECLLIAGPCWEKGGFVKCDNSVENVSCQYLVESETEV